MNYHIFVVDNTTFKYHLEYMFAGTGSGDKNAVFLQTPTNISVHASTERNLVSMIADISRIRIGDKIIFYLQSYNGNQGMFFGVFKAASKAFFDENDNNNYLKNKLNKALTFRIKIEPDTVYKYGISEHHYLDSLEGIKYPFQMCWSLIYRKLKGNRGCTMITKHEYNNLISKLIAVNNQMICNNTAFTFNSEKCIVEPVDNNCTYLGRIDSLGIKDRMFFKSNRGNSFEVHLQAYIMQNYDSGTLRDILYPIPNKECWIGNEVSCGVGMQRIDIMLQQEKKDDVYLKIIELKCTYPYTDIMEKQLSWYINWIIDYIAPNYLLEGKKVHIIPCIIALATNNEHFLSAVKSFKYLENVSVLIDNLEFIGFSITDNDIKFEKII